MAGLCSPVKAIDELRFKTIPVGRVIKLEKIVRFKPSRFHYGKIIGINSKGVLYSDFFSGNVAYVFDEYQWMPKFLEAVVRLGLINEKDRIEHLEKAKSFSRRKRLGSQSRSLMMDCSRVGVQLNRSQVKQLEKNQKFIDEY